MKRQNTIFDFFSQHRLWCWGLLVLLILLLSLLTSRLRLSENITDFLPLTQQQQQQLAYIEQLNNQERIAILFEGESADSLFLAIDAFEQIALDLHPQWENLLQTRVNVDQYLQSAVWLLQNVPYFLTQDDYQRIDSLLLSQDFIDNKIVQAKQNLLLPTSGLTAKLLPYDPLQLFSPLLQKIVSLQSGQDGFQISEGYMLSNDETMAFAFLNSPHGANETRQNAHFVKDLQEVVDSVRTTYGLNIRSLGSPVVAVGNAERIKKDSLLSVALSIVLILLVLTMVFKTKRSHLLFIFLTIGFGYLCGVAAVAVCFEQVSAIVLGIGSVIIGIAVNYPLHIVVHQHFTGDIRKTLKEELTPLVVGNITTIAAFLALLPLDATAMKTLGVFSAAMLSGTILFTIVWLPQFPAFKTITQEKTSELSLLPLKNIGFNKIHINNSWLFVLIVVLTAVFFVFGRKISFDTNLSHINYMAETQRADFQKLATLMNADKDNMQLVWIEPDINRSLPTIQNITENFEIKEALLFFPDSVMQKERLCMWNKFTEKHKDFIVGQLSRSLLKAGFQVSAFEPFFGLLGEQYDVQPIVYFNNLSETLLRNYTVCQNEQIKRVAYLTVPKQQAETIEDLLNKQGQDIFSLTLLQRHITQTLQANFDYIGLVCSLIVFVFLWLSMRSFRLAIVAFTPMLVSWVWILGLMYLFGMQFNIVNIILATFIFGQGDDYTIFITQGLLHEHRTGEKILPQFKAEIMLSAIFKSEAKRS